MKHYPHQPNTRLKTLVGKYENVSQNDEPCSFEKAELLLLADYFEFEKFPEMALEVIDYGIIHFQKSSDLRVRKTRLLLYHFGYQLAIELLNQKQLSGLNAAQIDLLQLEILIAQGNIEESLSVAAALKYRYQKTRSTLSNVFYLEALAYEKNDDFLKFFQALRNTLCINPKHKDAQGKLWMATELSKNSLESIELNKYLLEQEHYSAITWFNLGHAYYSEQEYEKAMEAFEFSIIINEEFDAAYLDLAEVCTILGLHKKSAQTYDKVINQFQIDELDIYVKYGESIIKSGEFRDARQPLQKGLLIDPFDTDLLFWLGETYRLDGKWETAIDCYGLALRVEDSRDDVHRSLAKCYFASEDFESGIAHYEAAIEINFLESSYRTELAKVMMNIENPREAEQVFTLAIEDIPEVKLQYHYAALLIVSAKETKGISILEKALQEDFLQHEEIYEFAPELEDHPKVSAIIQYFSKGE